MKNITTNSPIFYPNRLVVRSVDGDNIKCQFSLYWETSSVFETVSLSDVISLDGTFVGLISDKHSGIPDPEVIEELFREDEDLDHWLLDDCNQLISIIIQGKIRDCIDLF